MNEAKPAATKPLGMNPYVTGGLAAADVSVGIFSSLLSYNAQKREAEKADARFQQARQDELAANKEQLKLQKQQLGLQKQQMGLSKAEFSQNSLLGGYKLNQDMINRATDLLNNNQALANNVLQRWGK